MRRLALGELHWLCAIYFFLFCSLSIPITSFDILSSFNLSFLSLSPPPPITPQLFSLSSPQKKTLLTMLKSQQTKPWTTGINSHQQITESSVALFPEICNTLHMDTKCIPDARGSCVVQSVLSAPQDLCYVIKNCARSYPLPNMGDIFMTYCLCLHIYLLIFQLWCEEPWDYSRLNLLTHPVYWSDIVWENESMSQKDPLKHSVESWFVFVINRVHDAWRSSTLISG